jgi:phosphoglycolate phosphatase
MWSIVRMITTTKSLKFRRNTMTKPLQKPDAIFFDWDGTLVDSLPALNGYYNHVMSVYSKPVIGIEEAKRNIRKSARERFPEIFGDKADEALEVFYDYVAKTHLDHLEVFADSHGFMDELSKHNIQLGIVSNKKHSFLLKEITHLGWDKYLVSNIGAGEAAKDKPEPDPLLLAASKIDLSPDTHEIWYVGDTETDMMAAVAAGFQPIFIEHGLGERSDCEKHGLTPYFVKDLPQLMQLVQKFF